VFSSATTSIAPRVQTLELLDLPEQIQVGESFTVTCKACKLPTNATIRLQRIDAVTGKSKKLNATKIDDGPTSRHGCFLRSFNLTLSIKHNSSSVVCKTKKIKSEPKILNIARKS